MKKTLVLLLTFIFLQTLQAQQKEIDLSYQQALQYSKDRKYSEAAAQFQKLIVLVQGIDKLTDQTLFNGAYIFAQSDKREQTFEILQYLAEKRFYTDSEKLQKQAEFEKYQDSEAWRKIVQQIELNIENFPKRNRENIKKSLLEAKSILKKDNKSLWGHALWNDSVLVIDYDNTIYSLIKLENSQTDDHILYYKTIDPHALAFVNTTQKYLGKEYATVLSNYLKDKSATIIHELFHLLQFKIRKLNGNPIDYLENTDARILLRLEYRALRNTLEAIIANKETREIEIFLQDALRFRKVRQSTFKNEFQAELEIETLEGLANYTGFKLSTYENKYIKAISEIEQRERAETYTRPFPYATGPAYGLIFDALHIQWRNGLDKVYNFLEIYEKRHLKSKIQLNTKLIQESRSRNKYGEIFRQEKIRAEQQISLIAYYTEMLIHQPVLKVQIDDFNNYSRSFNMNGTISLKDIGIVYSNINGRDKSEGKNFGNFHILEGQDGLGKAGILGIEKDGINYLIFPLPLEVRDRKITGTFYEIELNPGWKTRTLPNGHMEIVKEAALKRF